MCINIWQLIIIGIIIIGIIIAIVRNYQNKIHELKVYYHFRENAIVGAAQHEMQEIMYEYERATIELLQEMSSHYGMMMNQQQMRYMAHNLTHTLFSHVLPSIFG